jgi:hypothetical protein
MQRGERWRRKAIEVTRKVGLLRGKWDKIIFKDSG